MNVELFVGLVVIPGHAVFRLFWQKKLDGQVAHWVSVVELHALVRYIPSLHMEHTPHVRGSSESPAAVAMHAVIKNSFIFLCSITVKIVFFIYR